ncbi:hypothetical protein CU097_011369 [Rhizopus azygosporus]|nr:hypothetical protein CU097_011369 [Rhizopus azygosporus]
MPMHSDMNKYKLLKCLPLEYNVHTFLTVMLFIESVKFDEIVGHHPQEIFLEKFNELLAIIQQTSDNTT